MLNLVSRCCRHAVLSEVLDAFTSAAHAAHGPDSAYIRDMTGLVKMVKISSQTLEDLVLEQIQAQDRARRRGGKMIMPGNFDSRKHRNAVMGDTADKRRYGFLSPEKKPG